MDIVKKVKAVNAATVLEGVPSTLGDISFVVADNEKRKS